MAKITYEDKNKEATVDTAPTLWRDIDANEVKNAVNDLYDSKADAADFAPLAPPDDLIFTMQSTKTLVLSQPTYRDEYPAMVIPASGAAAPDDTAHTIGGVARTLRAFDGNATQEILSGSFEIPHDYQIGGAIEVHVHWRPSTTGTGTVIWYFDWEYSPPNAAPIPQTAKQVEINIASDKQYFHLLSTMGTLPQPSTPFAIGGKIGFNIRRTPTTDTYGADALLEQISLHVPCDTLGSRQIYVK